VAINVAAPGENTPPAANHDQFYAIEDNGVSVFPGVLANDTDAEGNPLTALLPSGPEHGTLSLNASGSFHYQPVANFHGLDRFKYRASDGSLTSEVATVSIFVFNLNDRPRRVSPRARMSQRLMRAGRKRFRIGPSKSHPERPAKRTRPSRSW
jgi:VCBS repeat-containing protein